MTKINSNKINVRIVRYSRGRKCLKATATNANIRLRNKEIPKL